MGGRSMKDVGGAVLAGSTPPFLGRERAAYRGRKKMSFRLPQKKMAFCRSRDRSVGSVVKNRDRKSSV